MPLIAEGLVSRKICYGPPKQGYAEKRKRQSYVKTLKWNEAEHPRNPAGSASGGEFTAARGGTAPSKGTGWHHLADQAGRQAGPREFTAADRERTIADLKRAAAKVAQDELARRNSKPIHKVATPEEGVALILKGENVELQHTKDVHTILKKLGELAVKAKTEGSQAVNFDPCSITVKGTSLFCSESLKTQEYPNGIPRLEMPQFKSHSPDPGSPADALPRDKWNEVDATQDFLDHLSQIGVKSNPNGQMLAKHLKASQAEMEGKKVAELMLHPERDPKKARITVSSDGYVVDGHHTWAAAIGRDAEDGNLENDQKMDVVIIDLPMSKIYHISKKWTRAYGLPPAKVSKRERILKFNQHHDAKGLFASAPGGSMAAAARPELHKLVETLQTPDNGFTVHPTTGDAPTTGFVVSVYKGREKVIPIAELKPVDLVRHVRANIDLLSQDGNFIGAWHNPKDNKVYLDVSRVVQDRAEAQGLAEKHDQIAYFDIEAGQSVYTKKVA